MRSFHKKRTFCNWLAFKKQSSGRIKRRLAIKVLDFMNTADNGTI